MREGRHEETNTNDCCACDLSCWPPLRDVTTDGFAEPGRCEFIGDLGHAEDCAGKDWQHHRGGQNLSS
jgi:hypothetical protein